MSGAGEHGDGVPPPVVRIDYDDDQLNVVEKINKVLKTHGLRLADDDLPHEGYCLFTLQVAEGPKNTEGIDTIVDQHFDTREALFEHVGYVEDWRVLPIDDSRDQFWATDKFAREWVKFSPKREALTYWLAGHKDEYGPYGDVLFENVIYTQRHLPKWVYRGAELTLVVADTQTDGNKYLQLFRNTNEVHPGDHPSNLTFNHVNAEDGTAASREKHLASARDLCAKTSDTNLRIAIEVHRANCHQDPCLVLAAMEEEDRARAQKASR